MARQPRLKAQLAALVCTVCLIGAVAWFIMSITSQHRAEVALTKQAQSVIPAAKLLPPTAKADRAAALALIPPPPSATPPARATSVALSLAQALPDDVIAAARAVTNPLADPVAIAQSMQPGHPKVVQWLSQ